MKQIHTVFVHAASVCVCVCYKYNVQRIPKHTFIGSLIHLRVITSTFFFFCFILVIFIFIGLVHWLMVADFNSITCIFVDRVVHNCALQCCVASDGITFHNVADVIVISLLYLSKRHTETIDKSRGLKTRHQIQNVHDRQKQAATVTVIEREQKATTAPANAAAAAATT